MKRIQIFGIAALLLLTGAGCIYSRTGSYQTSVSMSDPTQVFPSAKWEPHDNAWRQEFSFRTYYQRSGVYDEPFKKLTPGGAHWGDVGERIEFCVHLPTLPFEWALMSEMRAAYEVVFWDRNMTTNEVELLTLPFCESTDRLLRQPVFRPYWTNEVFGIDFNAGERALAQRRGGNERLHYLEDLSDNEPVLWWKTQTGEERLVVLHQERNAPKNEYGWRSVTGYRLLYFENRRFVRAIKLCESSSCAFDVSTKDGRHVNVVNLCGFHRKYFEGFETGREGAEWMVLQADLQTGETKTVGRYADKPEGGKADGLEILVTERDCE